MRRSAAFLLLVAVLIGTTSGAFAQSLAVDLGADGSLTARTLQMIALITVLSLAPGLAIMITCFPFIVTVLAILRQGIGLQQSPPNMLIVSLALFLTYYIMSPVFQQAYELGIDPMLQGSLETADALARAYGPFRDFMAARVDPDTLAAMQELRGQTALVPADPSILIPSFMLSEIERAFQIGFLIFLPFLIIDLVVAAILMSMGMMMVPPAIVSLPFKLGFFVVADGWTLLTTALVRSYF